MLAAGPQAYLNWVGHTVPVFLVLFARTAGMLFQVPIFGNRQYVPGPVRTALAMALAIVYWASLTTTPTVPDSILPYLLYLLSEVMVGMVFGFAANITFLAFQGAGELLGTAISLNIASTLRIPGQPQSTVMGPIFENIAQVVFLVIGGQIWLLKAYYQTFYLIPLGQFAFTPKLMAAMVALTSSFFLIAIQLAMPAIMVMFLVDFGLGLINRAVPSISNILELVMALKPMVGFMIILLMIPNLVGSISHYTDKMIRQVQQVMSTAHR